MIKSALKKLIILHAKWVFGKNSSLCKILSDSKNNNLFYNKNINKNSDIGENVKLYPPFRIRDSSIGNYSYIAENSKIQNTHIGKFCSIGPNLLCGWGLHPTNGISTHPMFYSTLKQNGITLSESDKCVEVKPIEIGNDVFIGMNVTILDGVKIGDGAVIGAGAVVSRDILPYAIAVGCPIAIKGYRFDDATISHLMEIRWWDFDNDKLREVERNQFSAKEWATHYAKQ